jgi:hypothetical protein
MASTRQELLEALKALGEVLADRGLAFDLVVIGGAALGLRGLVARPTKDVDVVAIVEHGCWRKATKPLPAPLVEAVREVADALELSREPGDDKDWIDTGPSFLLELGLPEGFDRRVDTQTFGALTIRIAARSDLITLKLWAATDRKRGSRRQVDIDDLKRIAPTSQELRTAINWCAQKDGRIDFVEGEVRPVLEKMGIDLDQVLHG